MKHLGSKIKEKRLAAGITQLEVANWLGFTLTNYNPIENGKRTISKEKLLRLSQMPGLGVTYEDLQAWQALDEYGPEVLKKVCEELGHLGKYADQDVKKALELVKRERPKK